MTPQEAQEWFEGKRSAYNNVQTLPTETLEQRVAEADAAYLQQAYWTLRAHKEGLLNNYLEELKRAIENYRKWFDTCTKHPDGWLDEAAKASENLDKILFKLNC